jgi:hypothetical protein
MAVTLEEYRLQVLEQLKASPGTAWARDVLARADMVLASARLTTATQDAFWETLNSDLHILAEESKQLLGREVATALTVIIDAAQDEVQKYRRLLENNGTKAAESPR